LAIYYYKTRKTIKPIYKLLLGAIVIAAALLLAKPIAVALADFLTIPRSATRCDVIVVEEGGSVFSDYIISQALEAYYTGQAKKIILALHAYESRIAIFGMQDYRKFVESTLDSLKIPAQDYKFYLLNIQDPYTYNSALALADTLKDIRSLLLLNDNFHMRRSYLTFKKVFKKKNIAVYPYTVDIYLNSKNWWTSANGWRRVITEYIKLIFYCMKGYI
jgi:hypothetical protein